MKRSNVLIPCSILLCFVAPSAVGQSLSFARSDVATATGPQQVAVGDFNNDGLADIAVLNSGSNSVTVLVNSGNGSLTSLAGRPTSFALGDVNGDGFLDLIVNDVTNNKIYTLLGKGDGTFQAPITLSLSASSLALGDFNGDGKLDLVLAGASGLAIALGTGTGSFGSPTGVALTGVTNIAQAIAVDVNGDGKLDVITVNQGSNNITVTLGNGNGTFQTPVNYAGNSKATQAAGLAYGDLNLDGKLDIVTADSNGVNVYFGNGDGSFQAAVPYALPTPNAKGIAIADMNGDSLPDILAVADGGSAATSLAYALPGTGNGLFGSPTGFTTGLDPQGLAIGDFNHDHRPDFVTVNQGSGGVSVFSNLTLFPAGVDARAVFRDTVGSIRMSTYASTALSNSGGLFASDPSAAEDTNGNVFVTARDNYNSVWANVYNRNTFSWSGWRFGAGIIQGVPGIAVSTAGTSYIASRDTYNSYWLLPYSATTGFGSWQALYGIFSTDPVVASCGDGSIYLIGKDTYNSLWSGHYIPGSGFQGWIFGGGIIHGKPAATCGSDNAVYIVAEDNYNSNWMARVTGNIWTGWYFGGAITSVTPRIASLGNGTEAVMILDPTNVVWRTTITDGAGNGWQPWTQVGGILSDAEPAAMSGNLFLAGKAPNGDLWWWQQTGNSWTFIGNNGVAAGTLAATPH